MQRWTEQQAREYFSSGGRLPSTVPRTPSRDVSPQVFGGRDEDEIASAPGVAAIVPTNTAANQAALRRARNARGSSEFLPFGRDRGEGSGHGPMVPRGFDRDTPFSPALRGVFESNEKSLERGDRSTERQPEARGLAGLRPLASRRQAVHILM